MARPLTWITLLTAPAATGVGVPNTVLPGCSAQHKSEEQEGCTGCPGPLSLHTHPHLRWRRRSLGFFLAGCGYKGCGGGVGRAGGGGGQEERGPRKGWCPQTQAGGGKAACLGSPPTDCGFLLCPGPWGPQPLGPPASQLYPVISGSAQPATGHQPRPLLQRADLGPKYGPRQGQAGSSSPSGLHPPHTLDSSHSPLTGKVEPFWPDALAAPYPAQPSRAA